MFERYTLEYGYGHGGFDRLGWFGDDVAAGGIAFATGHLITQFYAVNDDDIIPMNYYRNHAVV